MQLEKVKMKAKWFFGKFASWHLWLNLLGMVLVLVLLFLGLKWWLSSYTHHGEGIEVPDFYGMDYHKASRLAESNGLVLQVNDSTYIKDMPAGSVVVQMPTKGMNVKEGRVIYVTINSLTVPRVKIPDLIGNSSYRDAQLTLQRLDFHLLPPKLIDGEKDWVYGIECDGRSLHTGDMVARESQLTLVIGNGAFNQRHYYGDDDSFSSEFDDLPASEEESTGNSNESTEDTFEVVTDEDFED